MSVQMAGSAPKTVFDAPRCERNTGTMATTEMSAREIPQNASTKRAQVTFFQWRSSGSVMAAEPIRLRRVTPAGDEKSPRGPPDGGAPQYPRGGGGPQRPPHEGRKESSPAPHPCHHAARAGARARAEDAYAHEVAAEFPWQPSNRGEKARNVGLVTPLLGHERPHHEARKHARDHREQEDPAKGIGRMAGESRAEPRQGQSGE